VPGVLLSGDHQAVKRWRLQQALGRTWSRRPDMLDARGLNSEEKELLDEYIRAQTDAG
jgi:tRNA (guanine37-N1)-methyltransferase